MINSDEVYFILFSSIIFHRDEKSNQDRKERNTKAKWHACFFKICTKYTTKADKTENLLCKPMSV